jgi:hypothetical protein
MRTAQGRGGSAAAERRGQWRFYTGYNGHWVWRLIPPQGRASSSKDAFETLTECIADARANGYTLWTSRERRRAS